MVKSNRVIREEKDTNLIHFIRFRFVPYWPLFGLLTAIACTAAFFYLEWAQKRHESAKTTIPQNMARTIKFRGML